MRSRPAIRQRTFNLPPLIRSLGSATVHLPVLAVALLIPATSRALREKVMLAVTSVNDCRYCSYVHTGLALANGVDLGELRQLLESQTLGNVDKGDAVATLFAQHFASTARQPSDAARALLARQFNFDQRLEIMAYVHAIYFANLSGNSADAWIGRLSGQRVVDGDPIAEGIAAALASPLVVFVALRSKTSTKRSNVGISASVRETRKSVPSHAGPPNP